MSLRKELAEVLAVDSRYSLEAYAFVMEAVEHAKSVRKRERILAKPSVKGSTVSRHVNGRELCEGLRQLANQHYGFMAVTVLKHWGIESTRDIGEMVFHLIDSGHLKKSANDSRADYIDVYSFEDAFRLELSSIVGDLD